MHHHGPEAYPIAASNAAKRGREKMEAIIKNSLASAESVIQQVQTRIVKDAIIRSSILKLEPNCKGWRLTTLNNSNSMALHQHAYQTVRNGRVGRTALTPSGFSRNCTTQKLL